MWSMERVEGEDATSSTCSTSHSCRPPSRKRTSSSWGPLWRRRRRSARALPQLLPREGRRRQRRRGHGCNTFPWWIPSQPSSMATDLKGRTRPSSGHGGSGHRRRHRQVGARHGGSGRLRHRGRSAGGLPAAAAGASGGGAVGCEGRRRLHRSDRIESRGLGTRGLTAFYC